MDKKTLFDADQRSKPEKTSDQKGKKTPPKAGKEALEPGFREEGDHIKLQYENPVPLAVLHSYRLRNCP